MLHGEGYLCIAMHVKVSLSLFFSLFTEQRPFFVISPSFTYSQLELLSTQTLHTMVDWDCPFLCSICTSSAGLVFPDSAAQMSGNDFFFLKSLQKWTFLYWLLSCGNSTCCLWVFFTQVIDCIQVHTWCTQSHPHVCNSWHLGKTQSSLCCSQESDWNNFVLKNYWVWKV